MPTLALPNRSPVPRQTVEAREDRFPFGLDFQKALLRLLLTDASFSNSLAKDLDPSYFEIPALSWAWSVALQYRVKYGLNPTMRVMMEHARGLDVRIRPVYTAILEQVNRSDLSDSVFLRDQVVEFIRRNIFVRGFAEVRDLYNSGEHALAYDRMMESLSRVQATRTEREDREWVCADLSRRHSDRLGREAGRDKIPTGMRWLDIVLEGGLGTGELGIWIAYPKCGKSTLLVNLGVAAVRLGFKNVLHCVLEGTREQVVNRYDACFSGDLYSSVKTGEMDEGKFADLKHEYEMCRSKLVVRAFTERWDYSILDINEEIAALRRESGWVPQLIVLDYGDLLSGRERTYRSEHEKQRAAFRDIKSLANRGYACWTASQAQRPKDGAEESMDLLRSRQISEAYEKVRVADFLGSININLAERQARVARLFAELYRDNEAEICQTVRADFSRMLFAEESGIVSPTSTAAPTKGLGSVLRQTEIPA